MHIDEIIVVGEEEITQNVIKIFELFRLYNIKAKPTKVRLGLTSVEYVDSELSHDGTRTKDEKTRTVLDFPFPDYVKQLSFFIGLAETVKSKIKWGKVSESEQFFQKS